MPHGLLDGMRFSFTSHSEQICPFPAGDYFEAILTLWSSLQTDCTMHLKACRCQDKTVCCVSESYKSHLKQSVSSTGIRVNSYFAVFDVTGMRSCYSLQRAACNVKVFTAGLKIMCCRFMVYVPSRLTFLQCASPGSPSNPPVSAFQAATWLPPTNRQHSSRFCVVQLSSQVCCPICGPSSGSRLQSPWTQSPRTRAIRTILDAPGDPTDMGKTKFYLLFCERNVGRDITATKENIEIWQEICSGFVDVGINRENILTDFGWRHVVQTGSKASGIITK